MNAIVHTPDNRRVARSVKLGLLGLLAAAGAFALLLMARGLGGHAYVTNDGPLDIRLVAVCPDSGEEFYNPDGRKLDLPLDLSGVYDSGPWKSDEQHRDFFLHVPDFDGQWLPMPLAWVRAADTDRILGGGSVSFDPDPEASTLFVSATFGRTYRRSWLRLLSLTSSIDQVDLPLRYYYGARREALCTFTGPFQIGTVVPADEGRPYRLTPEAVEAWKESWVKFHFVTNQPFRSDAPILFYDKQGRRHYIHSGANGRSGSGGADATYEAEAIAWNRVAAVTIGETPHEITFHNVTVQYPNRPPRIYAAYLDVLAQRLGLTGLTPEQLRQYHFKDPQQALEVLDIVRGWHIRTAFETLAYARPPVNISALDPAVQEKIHQVAARWVGARGTSFYGIQLGLLGHWPEFFDLALEQLRRDGPNEDRVPYYESYQRAWLHANREIASALARYGSGLNPSQARELQHAILTVGDGPMLSSLFQCLGSGTPEVVLDPLWELAQDDRPWIWWKALEVWRSRMALARKNYGDLPEKIRMRQILLGAAPTSEPLPAPAAQELARIFTPQLGQMSSDVWRTVHERIARHFDRKTATSIYLDCLRQMQSGVTERQWAVDDAWKSSAKWMVACVIRMLNVWYGVDLGHFGTGETADSYYKAEPKNFPEFQRLLAAVLQWRQMNPQAEPLEQSLRGKVVDTAGRGITTAQLRLIRYENYTGVDGGRYQRQIEVGRCRLDAAGDFAFRNLPNGSYALHLAAEGYAAPELVDVRQLPDGRFRIFGATQDDVLVLAKQASLSGTVIGSDGQPLANVVLNVSSYPVHGVPSHGSCPVDERGHFAVAPVTAGYHQLRYEERDRRSAAGEYGGRTAFRLVQVQEAQTIDNVVLDLRESTAGLEFEIVDGQGRPLGAESVSVEVEIPSRNPPFTWVTFLRAVPPQSVHRLPHLPPLEGYLRVFALRRQVERVPLKLVAGQITRCRISPENIEVSTDARPAQQPTGARLKEEGSSEGAPAR